MADTPREQWGSQKGFVLAAIGAAVGLGNMWRFPYLTAENGGAAFLVLYILMIVAVGLPVMLAEFAIGRGAKKSPIEALSHFGGRRWRGLGYLFALTGATVLAFYGVIAGWVLRYTWIAAVEGFGGDAAQRFAGISTGGAAVGAQLVFMLLTIVLVASGVRRGIEAAAVVLMPLLFFAVIALALYAMTLPGAADGYRFLLRPQLAELLSIRVLVDAAGQAFFSLSVGMGAMLTFGSYLSRDDHLPRQSLAIAGADFMVALVAGLMIFPLLFAMGLSGQIVESSLGALFITMPATFADMGAAGRVTGFVFFAALLVGALTSAISLLEVVVASVIDTFGTRRWATALAAGAVIALIGVPAALDLRVLGFLDQLAGQVFLLIGALLLAIFAGWVMPDPAGELRKGAGELPWLPIWRWFLRIVAPAFILLLLIYSLRDIFGAAGH